MTTQPVRHTLTRDETLGRQAEDVLRSMILGGELAAGERLNELALAAALGVSRGPLREAVQRLRGEGLVTVISHRGAFVRTFEVEEIADLYELRAALELHAIRILCASESSDWIDELGTLHQEVEVVMQGAGPQAYPAEKDFHLRLVSLTGNEALMRMAVETHHQLALARSLSARAPARAREAVVEHGEIVDALKRRDLRAATDLMQTHLDHAREGAVAALGLAPKVEPCGAG